MRTERGQAADAEGGNRLNGGVVTLIGNVDVVEQRAPIAQRQTSVIGAREAEAGLGQEARGERVDVVEREALRAQRAQISFTAAASERILRRQHGVGEQLRGVAEGVTAEDVVGIVDAVIDADVELVVGALKGRIVDEVRRQGAEIGVGQGVERDDLLRHRVEALRRNPVAGERLQA